MDFSGLEKLSLVDFDHHITATLFMAGCPFRCPFCHNSDLVLHPGDAPTIPWTEILAYLKKRFGILEAVCVSGGEPTLMPDLKEKLKDLKDIGYIVKLDSNGVHPEILKEVVDLGLVDYIAMDVKNSLLAYEKTIGASCDLNKIDESIHFLMNSGIDYEFRTTIVDEFHKEGDMEMLAKWIQGAKHYYLQRYVDNDHCIENGLHQVSKEKAERFLEIIRPYVPSVSLRDYD